jgi:hypothetical protein
MLVCGAINQAEPYRFPKTGSSHAAKYSSATITCASGYARTRARCVGRTRTRSITRTTRTITDTRTSSPCVSGTINKRQLVKGGVRLRPSGNVPAERQSRELNTSIDRVHAHTTKRVCALPGRVSGRVTRRSTYIHAHTNSRRRGTHHTNARVRQFVRRTYNDQGMSLGRLNRSRVFVCVSHMQDPMDVPGQRGLKLSPKCPIPVWDRAPG